MPDVKFEADKSCTLCHGHGLYVVGSSGSADDGDAPIYEDCDCAIEYISAEKAKADKLALLNEMYILSRAAIETGDVQQYISHYKQLKQRIEAE